MTLNEVKPGHGGVIASVGGEGALRRRLLDMGLTPNTHVQVRKVAPMGDPIELVLRGYVLTLRGDDAAKIVVVTGEENQPSPGDERYRRDRVRLGRRDALRPARRGRGNRVG